ncbi:acetate uptake transporter [Actinomycetospora endophytica]|uniref:Acetate uptake transporter n=1 Tax=Actinomycetospora endophytica TaxID=2291215 RepID=A0ABS8PGF0_9PSEU|nr:acetate uptake transporter [Actinomycetospora endophytica]MCD2197339.1 acetate uptake transporter [Actinomycetospora endophytica]
MITPETGTAAAPLEQPLLPVPAHPIEGDPDMATAESTDARASPDLEPASRRRGSEPADPGGRSADPGAWAVTAFATTSFMLGMYNTGLIDKAGAAIVIPVAFFFGGLIQIIVAILEIQRGNLFGAAVFGTYGPFWVIFAAIQTLFASTVPAATLSSGLCLFLAMFAVITAYLFVASLRTDAVLAVILALIFIGLVLLAIGEGTGSGAATLAGGWVTLAFAVLAWYHAASDIVAGTFGRRLLPVGPLT